MDANLDLPRSLLEIEILERLKVEKIIKSEGALIASEIVDIGKGGDFGKKIESVVVEFFLDRRKGGANVEAAAQLCQESDICNGEAWPFIVNTIVKDLAYNSLLSQKVRKKIKKYWV
jgi:hypothetical protein